ncbi:hypothetical protein B0H10DRAFT_2311298 [Mycena sp. CBHHK59/15]|nr:hypothetical protein B0H10DRAFT_2311298 [Mycena sp. CBHHK59/15]
MTTSDPCAAIFKAAEARVNEMPANPMHPVPEEENQAEQFGDLPQHGLPRGEGVFAGDFFGDNYTADEFGYIPDGPEDSGDEGDNDDEEDDPVGQDQEEASRAGLEDGYEAPRPRLPEFPEAEDTDMPDLGDAPRPAPTREARKVAEDQFHHKPIIEKYPGRSAGKPIPSAKAQTSEENYRSSLDDSTGANPYAPFKSKMDWEIAKWAKLRGSGSTAFTDLLQVEGVRESLDLSYGTSAQLNKIIDEKLPGRPKFTRSEVVVNGEVFYLYSRDILECVRALWGDTDFAPYLFVAPERHYIDKDKTIRMYHNMHTGKWWWSTQACAEAGIKPIYHPFWEGLPYTNIFQAISPDILHQLYQGIVKHLIAWLKACCGEAEIDARCRRLPPNHNIRLFMSGISNLSRVTGKEHDQISRFLLGIIIDIKLPNNLASGRLLAAVRGLLDFVYLAQYPMHTTETLKHLDNALQRFHDNKNIFVELGVREDFKLPKLHSCGHYIMYIKLFGTTDNYNTEYTERLHIDLAKDAYRSTNFKDEFPQMTLWLERKEKIYRHEKYIQWRLDGCPSPPVMDDLPPGIVYERKLKMTKHPTLKSVRLTHLVTDYGATFFQDALARYVIHLNYPQLSRPQIEARSQATALSFNTIPVFHRIKFTTQDPYTAREPEDLVVDSIHVQPTKLLKNGEQLPARFDTALVNEGAGGMTGVDGYRVAQVRVIFSLRPSDIQILFLPGIHPPKYLAYVEWFTPFTQPEPDHLMYKVTRHLEDGDRLASIIPVTNIRRSVHLLPKFGPVAPPEWKSSTVLDDCKYFFVNSMTDRHIYTTLF